MRQKEATTYETLIKHYNKDVSPQMTCECGKIITEKKHPSHLKSGIHKMLMTYKKQCEELKKNPPTEKKKKYKSQWDKFVKENNLEDTINGTSLCGTHPISDSNIVCQNDD